MSRSGRRPLVTVAVPNHNGRHLLATLLTSLAAQTYDRLEVVVVDDASTDDSCAYLAEIWPAVTVLAVREQAGVTAALNACAGVGQGELVLLLNTDIELDPRCVAELVCALSADPDVAVVQAKLLDYTFRDVLDGTGDTYSWAGLPHRRGQGEPDHGQYDATQDVFGACAAAALYRRSAFERVGTFDEQFFAFCEDVDWCFRARLAGYRCRYAPAAIAYHIGSGSIGPRVSDFTLYHNWRNQIWIVTKNYPGSALIRHVPDLLMGFLANVYVAVRHRRLGTWVRAHRDAMLGLPQMLKQRREIQRSRTCGTRQLEHCIESGTHKLSWWLAGEGRTTAPAAAGPRSSVRH